MEKAKAMGFLGRYPEGAVKRQEVRRLDLGPADARNTRRTLPAFFGPSRFGSSQTLLDYMPLLAWAAWKRAMIRKTWLSLR